MECGEYLAGPKERRHVGHGATENLALLDTSSSRMAPSLVRHSPEGARKAIVRRVMAKVRAAKKGRERR